MGSSLPNLLGFSGFLSLLWVSIAWGQEHRGDSDIELSSVPEVSGGSVGGREISTGSSLTLGMRNAKIPGGSSKAASARRPLYFSTKTTKSNPYRPPMPRQNLGYTFASRTAANAILAPMTSKAPPAAAGQAPIKSVETSDVQIGTKMFELVKVSNGAAPGGLAAALSKAPATPDKAATTAQNVAQAVMKAPTSVGSAAPVAQQPVMSPAPPSTPNSGGGGGLGALGGAGAQPQQNQQQQPQVVNNNFGASEVERQIAFRAGATAQALAELSRRSSSQASALLASIQADSGGETSDATNAAQLSALLRVMNPTDLARFLSENSATISALRGRSGINGVLGVLNLVSPPPSP